MFNSTSTINSKITELYNLHRSNSHIKTDPRIKKCYQNQIIIELPHNDIMITKHLIKWKVEAGILKNYHCSYYEDKYKSRSRFNLNNQESYKIVETLVDHLLFQLRVTKTANQNQLLNDIKTFGD